jgi:hypothetical protein
MPTLQLLQIQYTLGQEMSDSFYHIGMIRHAFPRNLAACFPDICNEIQQSFKDNILLDEYGNCAYIDDHGIGTDNCPSSTRMESIPCLETHSIHRLSDK